MIKRPFLSIVMCSSSARKTIKESLESISHQTYDNFEIILVLNGADDATKEEVSKVVDNRLVVLETSILQLSFNLNYAVNFCCGDYVVRMDSDDVAAPDRLELLVERALCSDADVIGSWVNIINSRGVVLKVKKYPLDHDSIKKELLYRNPFCHPSVMIRKSSLLLVGGYRGLRFAQDYELWLRMRREGFVFENIEKPLLNYRVHDNQSKGKVESYSDMLSYQFRNSLHDYKAIFPFVLRFVYFLYIKLKGR